MKQSFAVFDIDGTLIRWQLYHAIADALVRLGYVEPEVFQPVKDARMTWKRRLHSESFKDYERRLVAAYEALLSQLTIKQFEEAAQAVFDEYKDQVYTYTRDLIRDLKQRGYLLFAISNSQMEIVEKVTKYYGFDDWVGAIYEQSNGRFTSQVKVHLNDKDSVLRQLVAKHKASWKDSLAVGDSLSDASMLEIVENPIAFNPEQKLFRLAKRQGWTIVIERKNVVYKLGPSNGTYILA
ncbi:HAD family phosphatase [Candidatus Saccharibacteria bacterium]|nr:HAD family phosphatase [Candidatus Saccharibacteria bacterium]